MKKTTDAAFTFCDAFVGDITNTYTFPVHPVGEFGPPSMDPHMVLKKSDMWLKQSSREA
jgi:hypothetical protein